MPFQEFYDILDKYGVSDSSFTIKGDGKFKNVDFRVDVYNDELIYCYNTENDNYIYKSLDEFVDAKIFDGKSLKDVWDKVEINCFDIIYNASDYVKPKFENSIVFNAKHKDLATYEQLKKDRKYWLKFLITPLSIMLLSLVYFVCSLTVITANQPSNTIVSLIFLASSIITILLIFIVSDLQLAKRVKIYEFKDIKTDFYKRFETYWKKNFDKETLNEEYNENELIDFGEFEISNGVKIKNAYFLFIENAKENLEIIFMNDYAKMWNKKNDNILKYSYSNYDSVAQLLNDIKTKM